MKSALRLLLIPMMLAALGCDDDAGDSSGGERERADHREGAPADRGESAVDLARLFPLSAGDRWRIATTPTASVRLEGVTAVDADGTAFVHGTGHTLAERYRLNQSGIDLVGADGVAISPILRRGLRPSTRFRYAHRERDVEVPCEAEVTAVDRAAEAAGVQLTGCVVLERRCVYPAGAPFPAETTHEQEQTYCPGVGLVIDRGAFRPPPARSTIPADREERVIGFIVAGGPAPATEGCDRYILLPNDIVAACGTDVRPAADDPMAATGRPRDDGGCAYTYSHGTATLEAIVGASVEASEVPADALVSHVRGEEAAWLSGPAAACAGAERLAPLFESLLR